MWDDLNPVSGGTIRHYYDSSCNVGTGACWIVEYNNVPHYAGSSAGVFQVIMYAGGDIRMQFQNTGSENGTGSTTGVENNDSTKGTTYVCNAAFPSTAPFAICFHGPGTSGC